MRRLGLFLVRMPPSIRPVVLAAALGAFPDAEVLEVGAMDEIKPDGGVRNPELVVLAEPDPASAAFSIQALDPDGLPRWAVVILGRDMDEFAETVPPEQWNPPLLARVFRSVVQQHQLMRENLRLQGDLRTVARRVTHDLYTPVGCIYTSAHVLKAVLPQGDKATIEAMVQNIEDSSAEIAQIMDRVSFVLRASADPQSPERVGMAGVVAGVLRELDGEIRMAGATVVQPATWPEVSGVAQWLHVIWWNLLKNALTHGGRVPQILTRWRSEGDAVRFSVVGIGTSIAASIQAGLFRPFDQLHLLPAPGLGLSIVQRLVTLQGGSCGYERPDNGSLVFYFTIPAEGSRLQRRQASRGEGKCDSKPNEGQIPSSAVPSPEVLGISVRPSVAAMAAPLASGPTR